MRFTVLLFNYKCWRPDVFDSNIYTFRDGNAENSWKYARMKRINRLGFPLPDHLSDMSKMERKKYYFRVFDMATIYTFLRSRPGYVLRKEEKEILTNTKIDFIGMSQERRKILKAMKEEIQKLF